MKINSGYDYPVRFAVYLMTIAITVLSIYYCAALWFEKDTGNLVAIITGLGGIVTGLLVPTKINGQNNS